MEEGKKGQSIEKSERKNGEEREGKFLLGEPTFKELENGRFKCLETGHEVSSKDLKSYSLSKSCRLGLIDHALSHKKPPLNLFEQDPLSKSKLVCKLTGDSINKSEEHIWKHISGRRFLNKLEQKEADQIGSPKQEKKKENSKPPKKVTKKKKKEVDGNDDLKTSEAVDKNSDSDEDFWVPPVGSRWDFDDGNDRWHSSMSSGSDTDDNNEKVKDVDALKDVEIGNLSLRTKRMPDGPSSFASRKKKNKVENQSAPVME
ncbi:surfeit locus protein 2 isoform X2 [Amborella trichopoda]|uniref:Surfeit locus protein 2 n=1 Tax=Amborella trichopoda TaxID=13333 RepID=U5CMW6_AMBTC|nr:surfeit locus protein 2 isoform X2 [Amborella trichopoda]ERN14491.1 hypothetical protein AMTR_s00174p00060430 [Amborella trichopoda]|eukprot:XP_006853024.1 surfeit locus protein 2 isoform X2 [Amborella trichopoda]